MSGVFRIDIATLSEDESYTFNERVSSDFLEINDNELKFENQFPISGKAYLANDHLIIHVQASVKAYMPCSICNDEASFVINLNHHYLTKPISELEHNYFDFSDEFRQAILLEAPSFIECEDGACPKRKELKEFYKKTKPKTEEETYFPFENLENIFKNEG